MGEANLSVKKSHRRGWIDYARGFVIIYVVYRHAMTGLVASGIPIRNAIYLVQEASMPVFFIVSGIFISSSALKRGLGDFVKFKFSSLLYPYFVWAFIHLSIQILFSQYTNSNKNLIYYLYLFIAPRAIDQFWYLYTLFMAMILFAVLNFKLLKFNITSNLVVACLFYGISFFVKSYWFSITDILFYYVFLVFGFLIADYLLPVNSNFFKGKWLVYTLPLFILIQIIWWSRYPDIDHLAELDSAGFLLFVPITIIGALLIFLLSYKLDQGGIMKALRYIGSHSLYIYIMHLIFTGATRILIIRFFPQLPPVVMLLTVITAGIIFPIACYQMLIRFNIRFLFEPPPFIKRVLLSESKSQ